MPLEYTAYRQIASAADWPSARGCAKKLMLWWFLAQAAALTAQVHITTRVDSTRMFIGDQQHLYVQVTAAPDTRIQHVDLSPLQRPPLELVGESAWDTTTQGRGFRLDKTLRFTAWDSGQVVIPRIPVVFHRRNQTDTAWSAPIPIELMLVLPDTAGLAPIKPIIEEPLHWTDYLPWFLTAAVVALAALALWWWQRGRHTHRTAPPPPPRPPHELALEALEALRRRKLWQQGEVKAYYFELSRILRAYLEERYHIPALESTTGEIVEALRRKHVLKAEQLAWLQHALQLADMVKFAKAKPSPTQHVALFDEVVSFVEATRQIQTEDSQKTQTDA